jgi:carbonic anhydrase
MEMCIDPARALGLEEGDAHVIRNAGGRVTDAIRSIVISQQLLGTREIVIVHHVGNRSPLWTSFTDWIVD